MGEIAGLYYEERGPAGAPPVILSPGLGGSAAYWNSNLSVLEGCRVILYDHRGTGRSDRTLQPGLTVAHMADDVLALMDGLGLERARFVGHAAGGLIGLSLALSHPERLATLVVVNGFAKADPHFLRCMEMRLALLRNVGVESFVRAQPLFLYPARWIADNWERLEAEVSGHIAHFQGAANIEARIAALAAFDIEDRLGEIDIDLKLIFAEDDMLVPPSCSERIAAARPILTCRFGQGGHACNVTYPHDFNTTLRQFLFAARD
jgi:aminoacrylate hydrolase